MRPEPSRKNSTWLNIQHGQALRQLGIGEENRKHFPVLSVLIIIGPGRRAPKQVTNLNLPVTATGVSLNRIQSNSSTPKQTTNIFEDI